MVHQILVMLCLPMSLWATWVGRHSFFVSLLVPVFLCPISFSGHRWKLVLRVWTRSASPGATPTNEKREFVSQNPSFFSFYGLTRSCVPIIPLDGLQWEWTSVSQKNSLPQMKLLQIFYLLHLTSSLSCFASHPSYPFTACFQSTLDSLFCDYGDGSCRISLLPADTMLNCCICWGGTPAKKEFFFLWFQHASLGKTTAAH